MSSAAQTCPGPHGNGCDCKAEGKDPLCPWWPLHPEDVADEQPAARRRLTLGDVPEEVTFVDENGNVLPEYGTLKIDQFFASVVIAEARRWKQSIDTTLERMVAQAIRQYVAKRKVAV